MVDGRAKYFFNSNLKYRFYVTPYLFIHSLLLLSNYKIRFDIILHLLLIEVLVLECRIFSQVQVQYDEELIEMTYY